MYTSTDVLRHERVLVQSSDMYKTKYMLLSFFCSSRRRHTRCALVTGVQTCALPISVANEIAGVFCECNVTDDASVDAAFAKAREAHGQERILVNCAGTGNAIKTASRSKEDGRSEEHTSALQ